MTMNPQKSKLNPVQSKILHNFKRDNTVLTVNTGMRLGLARQEYDAYDKDMFNYHLGDKTRYQFLTSTEALAEIATIKEKLDEWIKEYSLVLGKETVAYLKHYLSNCKEYFPLLNYSTKFTRPQ